MTTEAHSEQHSDDVGFERMVFFSDAVMAIAITLMALEIRVPEIEVAGAESLVPALLQSMFPHVIVYIISFLVIGMYWVLHHRLFRLLRKYDNRLLWLNLIFLMFIGLLPVSTNALGNYPDYPLITVIYAVSVALIGVMELATWLYGINGDRLLGKPLTSRLKLYVSLRLLVPPLVFLASIPFAFVDVTGAKFFWAVQIPLFLMLRWLFPKEHELRRISETTAV